MSNLIAETLKKAQVRGNRLARQSEELFREIEPLLRRGAARAEIADKLCYSAEYTTHILEGMQDMGLIYKKRILGRYRWFVDDDEGRDEMKTREEALTQFRKLRTEQIKVLNKFCKEHGICDRCHNPNRPVVTGASKCQVCLDYLKQYAKDKRTI